MIDKWEEKLIYINNYQIITSPENQKKIIDNSERHIWQLSIRIDLQLLTT